MSSRLYFVLVLVALACLAFATEARLSDPTMSDESSTETDLAKVSRFASVPKFTTVVNTTKLELAGNSSMCEHIHPEELPEECSCREPGPFSLVIECLKTFNSTFLNDTIGMKIDLDPCNPEGAKLSLDVTEKEHNIDYTLVGIVAGESKNVPIPGMYIHQTNTNSNFYLMQVTHPVCFDL